MYSNILSEKENNIEPICPKNNRQKCDNEIFNELKFLVKSERKITSEILSVLTEIDRRMIYAKKGFPSLFEFCTKELGYSEGAANRRISAMRLIKQIPEIGGKLEKNEVNLSTLTQFKSFVTRVEKAETAKIKAEKKSASSVYKMSQKAKLEIIEMMAGKNQRQCERAFVEIHPVQLVPKEHRRDLSADLVELKFCINRQTEAKLERAKDILSNINSIQNLSDIFDRLLSEFLNRKTNSYKI
jgi:hypothetical protein